MADEGETTDESKEINYHGEVFKSVLLLKQLGSLYSPEQIMEMSSDELDKASKDILRSTSMLFAMSKEFTNSLDSNELEEMAREDARSIGAKEPVACQNAYLVYGNLIKEPTMFPSPQDLNEAQDQLGDIYVGCRLNGKRCLVSSSYMEEGLVRIALPKDLEVVHGIRRTVHEIREEGVKKCPASKISQEKYGGIVDRK